MELREIISYVEDLLNVRAFDDSSLNGLQVEGRNQIRKVAWCVTACVASLERAAQLGADLVFAHHGLFWKGQDPRAVGGLGRRLKILVAADMSLAAFHLPLDAHPELGNNAQIAKHLLEGDVEPWGSYHGNVIGASGRIAPTSPRDFKETLEELMGRPVLHLPGGPEVIRRVAVVSGGAATMGLDAARDGFDAFVTGEPTEPATHIAAEEGIHIFAAGHHATEVFGVRALTAHLAEEFGLEALDADTPNPI